MYMTYILLQAVTLVTACNNFKNDIKKYILDIIKFEYYKFYPFHMDSYG